MSMTYTQAITDLKTQAATAKAAVASGLDDLSDVAGATPAEAQEITTLIQQLTSLFPVLLKVEAMPVPTTPTSTT